MTSLTYENNDTAPIAKISSPRGDRFVYISENESKERKIKESSVDKVWDIDTINSIADALSQGKTLGEIINIFDEANLEDEEDDGNLGREIQLESDERIEVMPGPKTDRLMVAGPTGCGKSTFCAQWAKVWQALNPEKNVYLFARQEDDHAFDGLECEEIVVDDNILDRKLGIDDFVDSLVIFDDMDNLQDKKVSLYIHKLLDDLMACGRKKGCSVIYMSHLFLARDKTKIALSETNKIVFFPGPGIRQIKNVLKDYICMETPMINMLTNVRSRWCCLERDSPQYLIYQKGVFLL